MTKIVACSQIADVQLVEPSWFEDSRGRFCESFRKEWFPQRSWQAMQSNRSESKAGVLRGLHYHFHQVDYWQLLKGTIEVGLVDLRRSSSTYLQTTVIELEGDSGLGIYIPPGVAHGFYCLAPAALLYTVDQYYDGEDEHGVIWNDTELALAWSTTKPLLSGRDQLNPEWQAVPEELRPK